MYRIIGLVITNVGGGSSWNIELYIPILKNLRHLHLPVGFSLIPSTDLGFLQYFTKSKVKQLMRVAIVGVMPQNMTGDYTWDHTRNILYH